VRKLWLSCAVPTMLSQRAHSLLELAGSPKCRYVHTA
jgi:hypothetical protein